VQNHPKAAAPRNNLAWYLLTAQPPDLRDLQSALQLAQQAVDLEPGAGDFLDTYAAVLEGLGRHAEAQRAIKDGLARIPPNDPARAELLCKLQEP
jgi:tetratricopeptide (TPR) repeat protein